MKQDSLTPDMPHYEPLMGYITNQSTFFYFDTQLPSAPTITFDSYLGNRVGQQRSAKLTNQRNQFLMPLYKIYAVFFSDKYKPAEI